MNISRKISAIQRNIVLMFYIVFCLALIFLVWMVCSNPLVIGFKMPVSIVIIIVALMLVVFVMIGSYFYLIVAMPGRLSEDFDDIRNKVASREINDTESFAKFIIDFIIKQFNFVFLDVEYAAFGIADSKEVYFNDDFPKGMFADYSDVFLKCSETEDVICLGSERYFSEKLHKYLVPIHFGNRYLGFIIILTNKKLNSLFRGLLADFENFYIDDQLLHVLNNQKVKK